VKRDKTPRVFKHIFVPIDFSDFSLQALEYAIPIAQQFHARISLLHVVGPATHLGEFTYLGLNETEQYRMAEKRLHAIAKTRVPEDLLEEVIVNTGIAFDTIVETARTMKADLIVTTTHGHTGLKRALLGSTAERVVRHAPCAVLIAPVRRRRKNANPTAILAAAQSTAPGGEM